jgi:hypothetical protein
MRRVFVFLAAAALLAMAPASFAAFHNFQIDQVYSNADGTVQFIVLRECCGGNGENIWGGNPLVSTHAGISKTITFPSNLPSGTTANRRVLVATPGFKALGIVAPDYEIPNGFLATDGGTLNYSGTNSLTYASLPTDGTHAIDRNGAVIANLATNFAGQSASVAATGPAPITPAVGLWWNPNESGTGYNFDVKHGVLVVTVFAYEANGNAAWYLASGPIVNNAFTAPLDKYRGGQCVTCPYTNPGPPVGNDGTLSITFTSPTSAVVTLPRGTTNIQPQPF